MGWNNPAMPWRELEQKLAGRTRPGSPDAPDVDAPISTRKRRSGRAVTFDGAAPGALGAGADEEGQGTPYAELHCHSSFSFLDGASGPDALVAEASRLGLHGLALTDHDGLYGAPMLAETVQDLAKQGLRPPRTVYGAELSLDLDASQTGVADPGGQHLLVLARGVEGYHRLAAAITEAQLRGQEKGRPLHDLDELTDLGRGHWLVLTGCRKGTVRRALAAGGASGAGVALAQLTDRFGRDGVVVELTDHGHPGDRVVVDALAGLAVEAGLPSVATGNVHHARPADGRLAAAMAAVRARRSLADMDGWLPAAGAAHLRSGDEMVGRFPGHRDAVVRSVALADECAFDLQRATPRLPSDRIPAGHTAASWLRVLTERGFEERYAGGPLEADARDRVEHELAVIERKEFAGYFVIVHDIVAFARSRGIVCQGRGSAASSAVCFALGITVIDPVFYRLPFERFISSHRDEEPDIDVDFDSGRREEVIQWVYDTYGRRNAAQVANVITYRPKSAVRDAAKALGHSPGQQDAWSKQISSWSRTMTAEGGSEHEPGIDVPAPVLDLAEQFLGAPRHLGIHSGGMILTARPIGEVCPIEHARMEKRTVLQWDKDACEWMGLVKFDLLGLGMLGAIAEMTRIVGDHLDEHWTLAGIPREEPAVYDMLCRADSIGVFQVESRAQVGTLPRLRPRCFYDLAIEIALIRPGPIQGGAVHPYIRRATGQEEVTFAHPLLEPVLGRTLGVPLFQEQLMEMARVLGDCTADEADLLRRAMGSKRGVERIERVKESLYAGMRAKGMGADLADTVYTQILSFANFGFAESHSLSFAVLVYASSWFKLHYPAAFLAGLLRSQPMGFYSPQSLTQDARRHGVEVRRPCLERSAARADLEPLAERPVHPTGLDACVAGDQEPTPYDPSAPDPTPSHRRDGALAVRQGLDAVRGIGLDVAERIVAARAERPFTDTVDLSRRAGLDAAQLEALATAGALESLAGDRRQALWAAGHTESPAHLEGIRVAGPAPTLPVMDDVELTLADLWATGTSPDGHPFVHLRTRLAAAGIRRVADLWTDTPGRRLVVAGLVTHRQRPGTASGTTFLNLEDETGMLNVVCSPGLWKRQRRLATHAAGLLVRGVLERTADHDGVGVVNLVADRFDPLETLHPDAGAALAARHRSRDFQ